PWYPTVRLFRQDRPGQWDLALRNIADGLPGDAPRRNDAADPAETAARLCHQAEVKRQSDAVDESLALYDAAIVAAPTYWNAHLGKGLLLADLNRLEEAIVAYRTGLQHTPNCPELDNNLGTALRRLGRADEALVHLQSALARQPDH